MIPRSTTSSAMGAGPSKQIAVRVLSACQNVGEDDEIAGILLQDETFQQGLANLEIPVSLRPLVKFTRTRQRKEEEYGGQEVTEHRAFRSLWAASTPRLQPSIRRFLYDGYRDPRNFLRTNSNNPPQDAIALNHYLDSLYFLEQNRPVETVRWRLGLIPLADLFEKFNRARANTEARNDVVNILSQAGLVFRYGDGVRESLPSWLRKSKRYKILATKVGYGGVASLPDGPGDLLWEKDLPQKGPVHDACMKLLSDAGIKEAASENVAEDDQCIVTANTAAETMVQYLNSLFDEFPFLDYQPREPLRPNRRRRKDASQHVDSCNKGFSESQSESQRPGTLQTGQNVMRNHDTPQSSRKTKRPRFISRNKGDGEPLTPASDDNGNNERSSDKSSPFIAADSPGDRNRPEATSNRNGDYNDQGLHSSQRGRVEKRGGNQRTSFSMEGFGSQNPPEASHEYDPSRITRPFNDTTSTRQHTYAPNMNAWVIQSGGATSYDRSAAETLSLLQQSSVDTGAPSCTQHNSGSETPVPLNGNYQQQQISVGSNRWATDKVIYSAEVSHSRQAERYGGQSLPSATPAQDLGSLLPLSMDPYLPEQQMSLPRHMDGRMPDFLEQPGDAPPSLLMDMYIPDCTLPANNPLPMDAYIPEQVGWSRFGTDTAEN